MRNSPLRRWVFYIENKETGSVTEFERKTCKVPTRTKVWKLLMNHLSNTCSCGVVIESEWQKTSVQNTP